MKIGINATILDDKPTGLGIFTLNIINKLADGLDEKDEVVIYTSVPSYFKNLNVTVRKVTDFVQPKNGKKAGLIRFLWTQFIFPILFYRDKCDIIYSTTHHGNLFLTKKQVLTIHDLLPIKFPNQYRLQNLYFKTIVPHLIKKSPFLFTVSDNTRKDIVDYYHYGKDKIGVIYNSFDKEHFYHHDEESFKERFGDYLLFLGASYSHKNVERTIKAFLNYKAHSENQINLLIVNRENDYLDSVKNKFRSNKIFLETVKFVDYVSYNELPILYSNAVALIYTSMYEGFGIPPLEAMACGCPVVASNNSSIPEVCGNHALYIDPYDEMSIFQGMKQIVENQDLRKDLSTQGYAQTAKFDWAQSAQNLYCDLNKLHL
ncbi:glycosyltransferase family 4 protein [Sporolactobacillus terrae]|uniref:glycosyltransferase family 4 protein n=1 Tax=Sporolactobacillus terrae TaxID=269673 RepID=UPI001118BDF0|nr:glycosyltransferase family 1 protein [Sporolactobacillus terrae]